MVDPSVHSLHCVSTEKENTNSVAELITPPARPNPTGAAYCMRGAKHNSRSQDLKTGFSTLGPLADQQDDLYSEIIATTTKVKGLKKYFGDVTRPGICHRPHPKRYYNSFECRECQCQFSYLPSLCQDTTNPGQFCLLYISDRRFAAGIPPPQD